MKLEKIGKIWKKKKKNFPSRITNFFSYWVLNKLNDPTYQRFIEDLALLIAKGCMSPSMVENL
jgi:hypothetical protein